MKTEKNSITKSNALVDASYRLSMNETRIVLYGISLINPLSKEFPMSYDIDIKRFCDFFGIDAHDRGFYKEIRKAILERFWEREFGYWSEKDKKFIKRRILIGIDYNDQKGEIKIYYNPLIKDQLQSLSKNFTTYHLKHIANMKSIYGIRLYEMFVMHLKRSSKPKTSIKIPISELKIRLMLENHYLRFCDFKRFVLERGKKEINKHSDIHLSYDIIKQGRTPQTITFTVHWKTKQVSLPNLKKPPSNKLSPRDFEIAKEIIIKSGNRWSVYAIEEQFYEYIEKKGQPDNFKRSWKGFVQKKVQKCP